MDALHAGVLDRSSAESNPSEAVMTIKPPPSSTRKSPAKPKGRTKAEQRAETIELILNAAEHLFAEHGLHGVALKDVAHEVGVHTSLLNYYFADKKALFDAVIERRMPVTVGRRMEAMDAYEASVGGAVTVEGALRAYLDTDFDSYSQGGAPWRDYAKIGGQIVNTPQWGTELVNRLLDPVVKRLLELLRKAMPDAAEEDIFWGYQFVSAALMTTLARTGRIDRLSDGLCSSDDFEAAKARMAPFMAAGFRSLIEERARARAPDG
jgi:AcrR family transcriptional regulator